MAKKIEIQGNFFVATDTVSGVVISRLPTKNITWNIYNGLLHIVYINRYDQNYNLVVSELVDSGGNAFSSQSVLETFLNKKLGGQVEMDVNVQDQTTPLIIAKFSKEVAGSTLANQQTIDDYAFDVVDATGFVAGQYLSIFSVPDNRFYLANVLNVATNTITVDTPLDFDYPSGAFVTVGSSNMNLDGSITPQIFGLRNTDEAIGSAFDITRIIFKCLTDTAVDLSKFGDIAGGLTRGIVLRKKDGVHRNIFNTKTNGELKGIMFDFDPETATGQGQDGFTGRMTFGGQNKMGVVLRLEPGEDIQLLVQDDLTDLDVFEITAEGHTVDD